MANINTALRSKEFGIALIGSAAAGVLLALVDSSPAFFTDWLIYALLLFLGLGCLFLIKAALGASGGAWRAALSAYGVRLLVGVLLTLIFPVAGYADNQATSAGYAFKDAYYRDAEAWSLAKSGKPLAAAFTPVYGSDQYGGLLALSGFIYRYLSTDVRRPFAILLLAALAGGLGTLFAWRAAKDWMGAGVGAVAAWIVSLYPEAVLLGASQMREPFVIMGLALATLSFVRLRQEKPSWLSLTLISAGLLLFFQSPVALIAFFVLGAAWFIGPKRQMNWKALGLFAGILTVALVIVVAVWSSLPSLENTNPFTLFITWLKNNFRFQSRLTELGSGHIQNLVGMVGEGGRLLVFLIYGAARPVLPAALTDTNTTWLWYTVNLFRSAGWYLLAPLLVYASIKVLGRGSSEQRRTLIWFAFSVLALIVLAAANGGADGWDNPRYRAIFLPWQALLAGWGLWVARSQKDAWLGRWFLVEGIFVLLFGWWYVTRQPQLSGLHPGIEAVVILCLASAGIVFFGGWLLDRRKRQTASTSPGEV